MDESRRGIGLFVIAFVRKIMKKNSCSYRRETCRTDRQWFLLHDAMHKRGLCRRAVSVRPSVTFVYYVETNEHLFKFLSPSGTHTVPAFPY